MELRCRGRDISSGWTRSGHESEVYLRAQRHETARRPHFGVCRQARRAVRTFANTLAELMRTSVRREPCASWNIRDLLNSGTKSET